MFASQSIHDRPRQDRVFIIFQIIYMHMHSIYCFLVPIQKQLEDVPRVNTSGFPVIFFPFPLIPGLQGRPFALELFVTGEGAWQPKVRQGFSAAG